MQQELTPAGGQVERALAHGFDIAAFNLYLMNIRDEVAMTVGESPEWHRRIQLEVGWHKVPALSDEDEKLLEGFEPSLIPRALRDATGQIIGETFTAELSL